ncbi:MAG: substrate-binding domain-containing protein [Labilithrix sp.]|nr:substrate-binding domain-containing protein [Labilithrix sp.]
MRVLEHAARLLLLALVALLASRGEVSAEPAAPAFVVIVHPENPANALERSFVAEAFLKKTTRWPDGGVIKPVDLPPTSATRDRFTRDVLKRSVAAVKSYWQQIIFSGRDVPPAELSSDEAVVQYVLTHRGAIGYVSGSARLGDAKTVSVR